jgi:Ca2+-binding RTX toxin-like protein
VQGAPVTGSLLTDGTFGADGGFIKAIIVDGVSYLYDPKSNGNQGCLNVVGGASHGTFDTVTNSVTVASHNGGTLVVDMDTGEYTYTPPKITGSMTVTENFGYVISDNDGDLAGANLVVRVNPNAPPVAVDDHIITNILSPDIAVPAGVLLTNDSDPDGDHLSATPTTFNTGWAARDADFTAVSSKAINFSGKANTDANLFKNLERSDFFNNSSALTALVVLNGYLGAVNGATANAQDLYSVTLHKGETVTLDAKGDRYLQMEWQDSNGNPHAIAEGGTFTATDDGLYRIHVTNIANTGGNNINAAESYQLKMLINYAGAQDVTPDYHGSYTVSDGHGGSTSAALSIAYQDGHTLLGTPGDDVLIAGQGDNHLYGGDGDDVLKAGAGNNELFGGNGNDLLFSGSGNDLLDGGAGVNTVSYANATSAVHVDLNIITAQHTGGAGIDTLANVANLIGSNYDDTLTGGYDNNVFHGGLGNDFLNGGGGDDVLVGGPGNNTLTGGSGSDTFAWEHGNVGHDRVTDFSIGVDKLDLSQLLQGENASAASLDDYLHFKVTGSGASLVTTIDVSSVAGASPTQTIDLAGINLATHYGVAPGAGGVVAGGHDTASIINGMINDHSLKVDTV